ncbi:hypothetical protein D5086_003212 [Populus alba]|uniref:Uncharacterized protein n=1 Tax=Populus alba TaxID=43335 RepID=A0ACC4D5P0_POPAL
MNPLSSKTSEIAGKWQSILFCAVYMANDEVTSEFHVMGFVAVPCGDQNRCLALAHGFGNLKALRFEKLKWSCPFQESRASVADATARSQ